MGNLMCYFQISLFTQISAVNKTHFEFPLVPITYIYMCNITLWRNFNQLICTFSEDKC